MEYNWVILSLTSAFCLATSDALAKKAVEDRDEYVAAWLRLVFGIPLLLPVLAAIPVPRLDRQFYTAIFIGLPVELVTVILYIKALKVSPMSLTLPFLSITPVVLILVSYLILGETVSILGAIGIALIAVGGYVLNIGEMKRGFLGPIKSIGKEKGALYMIGVALLYSITSSMGKLAVEHSSALFFGTLYPLALTLLFAPFALLKGRSAFRILSDTRRMYYLFFSGLFYGAMMLSHWSAMRLTKVAYMVSVKRTSLLMGMMYGFYLFGEKSRKARALGALLMFAGFVIVVNSR